MLSLRHNHPLSCMRCPRTGYNVWCCRAQTCHGWEVSEKWGLCFTCCCHLPSTGLLRRWQFLFLLMLQPLLCALETQLAPKLFISTAFNKRYSYPPPHASSLALSVFSSVIFWVGGGIERMRLPRPWNHASEENWYYIKVCKGFLAEMLVSGNLSGEALHNFTQVFGKCMLKLSAIKYEERGEGR